MAGSDSCAVGQEAGDNVGCDGGEVHAVFGGEVLEVVALAMEQPPLEPAFAPLVAGFEAFARAKFHDAVNHLRQANGKRVDCRFDVGANVADPILAGVCGQSALMLAAFAVGVIVAGAGILVGFDIAEPVSQNVAHPTTGIEAINVRDR